MDYDNHRRAQGGRVGHKGHVLPPFSLTNMFVPPPFLRIVPSHETIQTNKST